MLYFVGKLCIPCCFLTLISEFIGLFRSFDIFGGLARTEAARGADSEVVGAEFALMRRRCQKNGRSGEYDHSAHLNPVRAELLTSEQPLERFGWSSYPQYLKPPQKKRLSW